MVVRRMLEKVGVVDFCVAAEIEFAQESAGNKQRQRAVNSGPRDRAVDGAGHVEEFLRSVVFIRAKRCLNNSLALRGFAQSFSREILV